MKIVIFIFFILCFPALELNAQTVLDSGAAARVWEVKSDKRTVYLLGEMHKFLSVGEMNIDYSLGEALYAASSTVWIEPDKQILSKEKPHTKISEKLSKVSLDRLERVILEFISKSGSFQGTDLKNQALKKAISQIDEASAFAAFSGLMALAEIKNLKNLSVYKAFDGLSMKLLKNEKNSGQKKIKFIESNDSVERIWIEECSDTKDTEVMIKSALDYYEGGQSFENNFLLEIQSAFLDKKISDHEFLKFSENEIHWASIRRCNIVPRNNVWIKKIIEALETKGSPQSFLVGNNHIIGEGGLIELLGKHGYNKIARINGINFNN